MLCYIILLQSDYVAVLQYCVTLLCSAAADIDECHVNKGGCSDSCLNTHGSFECTCPHGFQVKADERTCVGMSICTSF